ncbi:MAG: hypothetical protein EON48_18870, partial [Acetobacteraceae bacterium]
AGFIGGGILVERVIGAVGDSVVYEGRYRDAPARVRELWPQGVLVRGEDGGGEPADPQWRKVFEQFESRFITLGGKLKRLSHPHLGAVLGVYSAHDTAFRVEAEGGVSLEDWLATGGKADPSVVRALARQVAEGLQALHAAGIDHLDVSPATIAIRDARAVLTDVSLDRRPLMQVIKGQAGLARPGYAPIELFDGAMTWALTPATDLYGLCAVIWRLIVGRDPVDWAERTPDDKTLSELGAGLYPENFLSAVDKGLEIEPEDRFDSIAAWLAASGLDAAPVAEPLPGFDGPGPAEPEPEPEPEPEVVAEPEPVNPVVPEPAASIAPVASPKPPPVQPTTTQPAPVSATG